MELAELRSQIEALNKCILDCQRNLVDHPDTGSLRLQLQSYTKLRNQFESQWVELANNLGQDVCTYYIHSADESRPSIRAVSDMLSAFQRSITTVYDALKSGPRERANTSKNVREETSLEFGFTSPGSLMVTCTIQNRQMSFWEDSLDTVNASSAIDAIYNIAHAGEAHDILEYSKKFGRPAIRSVYSWIATHLNYDSGIRVLWHSHSVSRRRDIRLHRPNLIRLKNIMEEATDQVVEDVDLIGYLDNWNRRMRRFAIVSSVSGEDEDKYISGKIAEAFDMSASVILPGSYNVSLKKIERREIATDNVDVQYELHDLKQLA